MTPACGLSNGRLQSINRINTLPISYSRDDAQRRIVAVGEGAFRAEDILGTLDRMRADGTWSYGILYDLRRSPTLSDLGRLRENVGQPGPQGEHGPRAIVVSDPALYARMCAYKALGPPGRFDVFSNRAEAEAWLAEQTTRANP
jgi:hypothetical protein